MNMIPQKPYAIKPAPHILEEISAMTKDFELLEPAFRIELIQRVRCRSWGRSFYGAYNVTDDVEALKLIIGKGGYYFKLTTENTGIDLIWHDRSRNIFCFWAPDKRSLIDAMDRIRSRIVKITVHVLPENRLLGAAVTATPIKILKKTTVMDICQTPPPAPERTSPPRLNRTDDECLTRSDSRAMSSPPAHRRPMQRSASIIMTAEPEPEIDPMEYQCFRTSSMLYPTHLSEGQRSFSVIPELEDISDYEEDRRTCPEDEPGRKEYYAACGDNYY
jgi:hypothetical protein